MSYPSGLAAKKGIIISASLNGAMAVISNQLKNHLESGVTRPRLHQVKTGLKLSVHSLLYIRRRARVRARILVLFHIQL